MEVVYFEAEDVIATSYGKRMINAQNLHFNRTKKYLVEIQFSPHYRGLFLGRIPKETPLLRICSVL